MYYQSTRNDDIRAASTEAVLRGLASDGGLYIPPEITKSDFDWRKCLALSEFDAAEMILSYLLPEFEDMPGLIRSAYSGRFEGGSLSPLVKCGDAYVLELFHGPTCAFKDVALCMLPRLITKAREQLGVKEDVIILTATSGDTGKAALEGFHDVGGTGIVVFYPYGGVSPVQRAQMVTQEGKNVRVCALRGNFDDCQRGVKAAFSALGALSHSKRLSSANSISIGRLAPQVIYYFSAYSQLLAAREIELGEKLDFIVPSGNFGDILAGYFAKLMGLPVGRLVCASNENKVLRDFILSGTYDARRELVRTMSPSMDILVSSNLERLLYLASGGDTASVGAWMGALSKDGVYTVDKKTHGAIRETFSAGFADEAESAFEIARVRNERGYLCDPHTAVAFSVMEKYRAGEEYTGAKCVVLSTASAYKFPAAVLSALGAGCGGDGRAQMEKLSELTGTPIPAPLASLRGKAEIHTDVIDRGEILSYIENILDKGFGYGL